MEILLSIWVDGGQEGAAALLTTVDARKLDAILVRYSPFVFNPGILIPHDQCYDQSPGGEWNVDESVASSNQ